MWPRPGVKIGRFSIDSRHGGPSNILWMLAVPVSGTQTTTYATAQLGDNKIGYDFVPPSLSENVQDIRQIHKINHWSYEKRESWINS